jgi:hypothetical protein
MHDAIGCEQADRHDRGAVSHVECLFAMLGKMLEILSAGVNIFDGNFADHLRRVLIQLRRIAAHFGRVSRITATTMALYGVRRCSAVVGYPSAT